MKFERKLIATTQDGKIYTTDIVANNSSISEFRNSYCNWEGKRHTDGFRVEFTHRDGEKDSAFATTRKLAVEEVAHRIVPYSKRHNITVELVKHAIS